MADTGIERIEDVFRDARGERRAAYMPYHSMGYPDRPSTLAAIKILAESGADLFEIGIPHSDPLADGPTIQAATHTALTQGTTVSDCLLMVRELRDAGLSQPFCAMTYFNPVLRYGTDRFVADAVDAGLDGLIIPDLPPEEAEEIEGQCRDHGLATIFLLAPTSTEGRIRLVTAHSSGFVYLVSVTGTTGARSGIPADLSDFVKRVRAQTTLPLAVGFGIGTRQQAAAVAGMADGVIVGSALVKAAGSDPSLSALRELSTELAAGCHEGARADSSR
jgi:tryptophan synthase alpha chain